MDTLQENEVKPKRKTHTSTEVKNRYNKKVYDVISIRIPKELAQQFKQKCNETNTTQAQIIKNAIISFLEN